jgi:Xaa-Pro aminopeptidase
VDRSFPTIAGVNSNGAIIHYRAEESTCKLLTKNDMLLLDSGAQYEDGTTDVTRTIHMGTPSATQKEMFTRVLKGHIALDSQIFPSGTAGCQLDSFAREHLWAIGKDYIHGTGHGVGAALNVHEGPQRISRVIDSQPLLPGMIVSNEPGYYETGEYGIRIENLLEVVNYTKFESFGGRSFLAFNKLTFIPIQLKLIDQSLLSISEKLWLNDYHKQVRERVSPYVVSAEAKEWLIQSTEPIPV